MGQSSPDKKGKTHAQLDVLITPSCDDKGQIKDMLTWGRDVLTYADKFSLDPGSGSPIGLTLRKEYIQPGLWTPLFQDADVDPPGTPPNPTPIAPHGVSLNMSHNLAHKFYSAAHAGPIDSAYHGPQLDFLRTLHTNAITDHGLFVPSAAISNTGGTSGDDQDVKDVLNSIANAQEGPDADTLIRSRFGIEPPTINRSNQAVVAKAVTTSGGTPIQPPKKALHALAHLKLHLTNSLRTVKKASVNTLPTHPRPDHFLYHVNRLTASAGRQRSAGAAKVAAIVMNRPHYNFNQRVTLLLNMPAVLEALALVLHFEFPWDSATNLSSVKLVTPAELTASRSPKPYATVCTANFLPKPKSTALLPNGWINPNDGYSSGSLQLDSAAMQITQFASQAGLRRPSDPKQPVTVTVSYDEDVDHPLLPPSPHTGGFQVWQEGLQAKVIDHRGDATNNAQQVSNPLYAEDLRNGVVVDILATNPLVSGDQGSWIPLCVRDETFRIGGIKVKAQRAARGVRTSAARSIDPGIAASLSHDVDETIFTWRVGSLVVRSSLATEAIKSGTAVVKPPKDSQSIPWGKFPKPTLKESDAVPSPLFGMNYGVSMRSAFVTGGVVPFDKTDATSALLQAKPFQRYELVQGPALIPVTLTEHYLKQQSPTMMFVGSKVGDDLSISKFAELSQRVIVPSQVTAEVARRHGKPEDLINQGASVFPLKDGSLPSEIVVPGITQPTSGTYLPDPMCTGVIAILTDLGGKVLVKKSLDFYRAGQVEWPNYVPHIVELQWSKQPEPSLEVDDVTSAPGVFPFLQQGLSKAFICKIPPGMTYLLALRPQLDPKNISNVHAFSLTTQAGDTPSNLDVEKLALSDVCRPTMIRMTHATDRPIEKPQVTMEPPLQSPITNVPDPTKVFFGTTVERFSTSKAAILAQWQEMTDDLKQNSYTKKALQAQLTEFSVSKKDASLGVIKPIKTQFPFSDGRYRQLTVTARGTSRYGDVFGKDDKQIRTLDGNSVLVDVLATAQPKIPDIEYILPNLRWELQKNHRTRTMGLTVVLNRPWFTSGAGEQFAVITAPCLDPKTPIDSLSAVFPTANSENNVSAWGVMADWVKYVPNGVEGKSITILTDFDRVKDGDDAAPSPDLPYSAVVTIGGASYWALLFTPRFNELDQQWFVNLSLSSPPAYGAVVRLLTARYQQHAIDTSHLSDVSTCDFALLRPDRAVSIKSIGDGFQRKMQIQIVGVGPVGAAANTLPRTVIEVRHFETDQKKPHYFDWQAGDVIPVDANLPSTGNVLWQGTFGYPWQGGHLVAQEWEVWPTAEDLTKSDFLPVFSDFFPMVGKD
jgi:hypothetical protein